MKKVTQKQVDAALDKYHRLGLQIENAKRKAGYSRAVKHGELQAKKGRAYGEYLDLLNTFNAQQKEG